jgi:alkanesulfonate monooxygenase SsuD/methylene tetrahydromethanopterin reductase-like flavin-dependent oxidoreductase (luciferase family)
MHTTTTTWIAVSAITLPTSSIREFAVRAEEIGFDMVWIPDELHLLLHISIGPT